MEIDPVVALAEQLRNAERSLQSVAMNCPDEKIVELRTASLIIRRMLETTEPTSAIGAAELLAIAADRLTMTEFPYVEDLRSVGLRFGDGRRVLSDLIWLRAVVAALDGNACGERGRRAALLIRSAIEGAAKPLIIFRAAPVCEEAEDSAPPPQGHVAAIRRFCANPPLSALSSAPDRSPAGR